MQAKFVNVEFSWKRVGLAEVQEKGVSLGGKKHKVLCPEDSYSCWDVVRELHIDWRVKLVLASPWENVTTQR